VAFAGLGLIGVAGVLGVGGLVGLVMALRRGSED
jgi:hypothetical protein